MAARHFDPEILTVKNPTYWRTYYLIRDKQFVVDAGILKQDILAAYPKDQGFFNFEPDVLLNAGVPQPVIDNMAALARHYCVSVEFVRRYLDGYYPLDKSGLFHALPARAGVDRGWIVLRMGLDITSPQFKQLWGMLVTIKERPLPTDNLVAHSKLYKPPFIEDGWVVLWASKDLGSAQFRQLWPMVSKVIEAYMGSEAFRKRRRSPAKPELVYYIEKALKNGSSFQEITGLYNDGRLPGYTHEQGEREFSDKDLREYYNDYRFLIS